MKQTLLVFLLLAIVIITKAQPPSGYYNTASGKTGAQLKTALYNIIKGHTVISYDNLYNAYKTTDDKPDGSVWDMYSNCSFSYNVSSDRCGSYNSECDCFNREHSVPQSWFGSASPMVSEMFHVYPTDGKVNGMRSNYPFGEVTNPSSTSGNGSKLGPCSAPGYTSTVFEPIDEYKGDFARTYFYMATRYENIISTWHSASNTAEAVFQANTFPVFENWVVNMFLKWNTNDPVSQKEIDRNNTIYTSFQKNRNPYIDHPEYANLVWGLNTGVSDEYSRVTLQVYPNPVSEICTVTLPADFNQQNTVFTVYSSTGMPVFAPATVTGGKAVLNLENAPPGFYLVRLANGSNHMIYQARIIKK